MRLIIGAPVRRREWIAEHWVDHVASATIQAGVQDRDVELLFVSHPDDPTNVALNKTAAIYGFETTFINDIDPPTVLERCWDSTRLHTMVRVRNLLLQAVREREPDLFLSLDTDILAEKDSIRSMIRLMETARKRGDRPAVTSHCVYLTPRGTHFPNYAMLTTRGNLKRGYAEGTLTGVDVLMAAKLMTPRAYNVDYLYDRRGEDIGWSLAVRQQGMHLAWTGKVTSKHCMEPSHLDTVDVRCGY